jgi:hypothetical protein
MDDRPALKQFIIHPSGRPSGHHQDTDVSLCVVGALKKIFPTSFVHFLRTLCIYKPQRNMWVSRINKSERRDAFFSL